MLLYLLSTLNLRFAVYCGTALSFLFTAVLIANLKDKLPRDGGREFAVNGKLSAGKVRGVGIVFVSVFVFFCFLFLPLSPERSINLVLLYAAMITGFLDDAAKTPWGEYKKGILDLLISVGIAVNYVYFNGSTLNLTLFRCSVKLPAILFVILAAILVWVSINVTNCTDGVDSLSATLTIITLFSFWTTAFATGLAAEEQGMILFFLAVLLAYLWMNAKPSIVLMGDAGSRAMGVVIALIALKSGSPLLYLPFALVMILDGGLGLLKVSLKRFLKISIFKNTIMPLHDQVRKKNEWSDPQTVFRFAILQAAVSFAIGGLLV